MIFDLMSTGSSQVHFFKAAFQTVDPQHVLMPRVVLSHDQDLALLLAELDEVHISPYLQSVQVPLDTSTTPWCISYSSQFCAIRRLAVATLYTIMQVINEDVKTGSSIDHRGTSLVMASK